jgi:hypothetical protein
LEREHAAHAPGRQLQHRRVDQPVHGAGDQQVAQIDVARKLTEAIWHMLINIQPFAPGPGGSTFRLAA